MVDPSPQNINVNSKQNFCPNKVDASKLYRYKAPNVNGKRASFCPVFAPSRAVVYNKSNGIKRFSLTENDR